MRGLALKRKNLMALALAAAVAVSGSTADPAGHFPAERDVQGTVRSAV